MSIHVQVSIPPSARLVAPTFLQGARHLLNGSGLFLISTTVVNLGNYLFNLVLGRWLGPLAFAELSLGVTLFLMLACLSAAFRLTAARYTAIYTANQEWQALADLRHFLRQWAWRIGGALAVLLIIGAPLLRTYLHTQSVWPFVLLGLGTPFFLLLGNQRGNLQGALHFPALIFSYQVETWSRFGLAVLLVTLGWSANGALGALALSLLMAWWLTRLQCDPQPAAQGLSPLLQRQVAAFAFPLLLAEASQILINNSDLLLVKHFFAGEIAGLYAALALSGRVIFFATWAIMTTVFPLVVQKAHQRQRYEYLFWLVVGLVVLMAGSLTTAAWLFPQTIVNTLFGAVYLPIAPLLWQYALLTSLYALASVILNFQLALGRGRASLLILGAGVAQVTGLWLFHASINQVVMVQAVVMGVLLGMALLWHNGRYKR
jgi:O-antigen/teichoic acid export membrane protein